MDSRICSNCSCSAYEARIPDASNLVVEDLAKSVKGDYLVSDVRSRGTRRPRPSKDPPTDVLYLGKEKQSIICDCPCRLYHRKPNVQAATRGRSMEMDTTMAEEYCLDDGALDLAPFYSNSSKGGSSSSVASSRRFVTSSSKPALKTVSIMETLSELAGSASGGVQRQMRRLGVPDPPLSSVKSLQDPSTRSKVATSYAAANAWAQPKISHVSVARKMMSQNKCTGVENVSALRSCSSTTSASLRPSGDAFITPVTRMNGQSNSSSAALQRAGRRGRSAEDILAVADHYTSSRNFAGLSGTSINTSALSEGFKYGSLERQCRRKTSYGPTRRRGETDWEREADEEEEDDEDVPVMESKSLRWVNSEKKLRERGQTPDWIRQIFQVVQKGDVEALRLAVEGMEPTLVRNLSDHSGNNLWHVLCNYGHEASLVWLCSHVGAQQSKPALLDQNKRGLTPVVLAIKAGHVGVVQFLVSQAAMGVQELLAPQEGERCLLHVAAKYGQVEVLQCLLELMTAKGLELEPRDRGGHTALHLAAKNGHASAAALLVAHGADVTAKNDMGHRPMDVATKQGHVGVAQLLRLQEVALSLAADFTNVSHELDSIRADHAELKSYFRDVLGVAKRMTKERDEMCREWGRFYEELTSSHQAVLMELTAMQRYTPSEEKREESEALIEALHERWQTQSRAWFSGSLAEYEHRLLLAEEGWKRLRLGHSNSRQTTSAAQELLRNRLASLGGNNMQSYDATEFSSPSDNPSRDSESDSDDNPRLSKSLPLLKEKPAKETLRSSDNLYSAALHASVHAPLLSSTTPNRNVENVRVTGNLSALLNSTRESRQSKAEMRQKLQEVKLISESGNASVLEVIEPTSSSSSCCDDEELAPALLPEHQSTPKAKAVATTSVVAIGTAPKEPVMSLSEPTDLPRRVPEPEDAPGRLAEPDLLAGTIRDPQAAGEPSSFEATAARDVEDAEDVTDSRPVPHEDDDEREEDSEGEIAAHEIYSDGGYQSATVTESQLSVRPGSSTSFLSLHSHKKRSGFLTKFALKSRWPSKRKPKLEPSSPPNSTSLNKTADEPATASPGRVADLSQMFEDLGTNTASSHVPPPLPPREPLSSSHADTQNLFHKLEIKSSSASSTSHGMESVSVGTSEDSGIVVMRPMSAASRPDSSSSALAAFAPFQGRTLHHKAREPSERLSPAPSESESVSRKSESVSSPASDVCKSDTGRNMRHLSRIEEAAAASNGPTLSKAPPPPPVKPKSLLKEVGKPVTVGAESEKNETTWREAKLREQLNPSVMGHQHGSLLKIQRVRLEEYENSGTGRNLRRRHNERPWYDVSDDESDLLTPERLTQLTAPSSSDDDVGLQV